MQTAIIIILFVALIIFYFYHSGIEDKYKESYGTLEQLRNERLDIVSENAYLKAVTEQLEKDRDKLIHTCDELAENLKETTVKLELLDGVIEEKQKIINDNLEALEKVRMSSLEAKITAEENSLKEKLKTEEERVEKSIQTAKETGERLAQEWASLAEDAREKYLSIIGALRLVEQVEEKRMIKLSEQDKEDMRYLIEAVVPRINHKDTINKLIWQEYIQKPFNEILEIILPNKECSGIYKITNVETKKSYIGRSTNVKKRLQDHVKSACGISTIADQKVHQAMREEGLWNFQFELLEECDKNKLGEREKYYIEFFDTQRYGYNQVGGSAFKE